MRIQRTVPPAAALLSFTDLLHALGGQLTPRRYLRRLENELKRSFDVRSVYLLSSGTAALYLILEALKSLSPRRDVVIPAYTCFSVASAVVRAGLRIRLCDLDPDGFDFDYDLLARSIDSGTLCVVSTHLFGMPADTERVMRLCADRGVYVIEDAAQAMGGRRDGKLLGTIADAGFFSAGRGKNITCGSGGIVVTRSDEIAGAMAELYATLPSATRLQALGDFLRVLALCICIRPSLYWLPASMPFLRLGQTIFDPGFPIRRLSGMKAGLLRRWRQRLEASNGARARSGRLMGGAPIPYLRFPLLMGSRYERDRTYGALRRVGASLMYPTPISEIPSLRWAFDGSRFPVAERIANTLVTLPTHELVSTSDREVITHHVGGIAPISQYDKLT